MLVRIITNRLNSFQYGQITEEDSPRIKCLLENGEAELVKDETPSVEIDPEPMLADREEEAPVEAPVVPVKKKAGRPKKVK